MIDLEELERLAKAATPGPWEMLDARAFIDDDDFEILNGQHCIGYGTSEADAAYIVTACNAVPELIERVRELERQLAELTKENSGHKRVIHILENKVLELKGKPIPMEPRQFIPLSNRSNAKEAGE